MTGILQGHIQDEQLECNNERHERTFRGSELFSSTAVEDLDISLKLLRTCMEDTLGCT